MEAEQVELTTQKKQKESDISGWMIAFGVGVTITAAAATTVYVIQSRRNAELHALKLELRVAIGIDGRLINIDKASVRPHKPDNIARISP